MDRVADDGHVAMGIGVPPDASQHEYVLVLNPESGMVSSARSRAAHPYPNAVARKPSARARYHTHLRAG
jgi:hypothetical protein